MTIAQIIADTKTAFAALPAGSTNVQALSGDRIEMLTATGETSDVLTVMLVKKRVLVTKSEVTGDKISVPVMTYDADGIELADGTKAVLHKSPTAPKPAKKGGKKVVGAPSKLTLCKQIFLENPEAAKADVCKRFQAEANCTRMGANTYYLSIAKLHAAGQLAVKADADEAPAEDTSEGNAEVATEGTEAAAE